jgi:hypothetical protein
MAKCPKCKKKIEVLSYTEDVYGRFALIGKNSEPNYNPKGGEGIFFSCPECYAQIANCEEDAIEFLTK